MSFWRDSSDRLTWDLSGVEAEDFAAMCAAVSDAFHLVREGDLFVGLDGMYQDFRRDDHVVGLNWDCWFQFMVVAKSQSAESLVREIGAWLETRRRDE